MAPRLREGQAGSDMWSGTIFCVEMYYVVSKLHVGQPQKRAGGLRFLLPSTSKRLQSERADVTTVVLATPARIVWRHLISICRGDAVVGPVMKVRGIVKPIAIPARSSIGT